MSPQIEKAADIWIGGKDRFVRIMKAVVLLSMISAFAILIVNLNASPTRADTSCDCESCHSSNPHGMGCSSCHDSPPQTGTHLIHFNSGPTDTLSYGDTTINSTDDAYKFGCGNCHPLDLSKHGDGVVEVELYDINSPSGSIKSMNPSNAAYTPGSTITSYTSLTSSMTFTHTNGTCSNVYCHSGPSIASTSVGLPSVDASGNITYPTYTVTYSRVYKTTPAWGTSGTFTTCTECHQFPLTTSYPTVEAGVGDSHQWIDDYGYGNLHAFNMSIYSEYVPVNCRTCHYGTVMQANTWTRDSMDVTTYNQVSLVSRRFHVNGSKDIIFDTTDPISYNTITFNLIGASYDSSTKSCSNVACHLNQTSVKWGSPYRWWNSTECDVCHRN